MLNRFGKKQIRSKHTPDHKMTKFEVHFVMEISNSKSNDPYCIKFLIVSYGNTRVMPTIFFVTFVSL